MTIYFVNFWASAWPWSLPWDQRKKCYSCQPLPLSAPRQTMWQPAVGSSITSALPFLGSVLKAPQSLSPGMIKLEETKHIFYPPLNKLVPIVLEIPRNKATKGSRAKLVFISSY